jgi:hypothetical protein
VSLELQPEAVVAEKAERRRALLAALTGAPFGEDIGDAREQLRARLGPDALAELDQRLLDLLQPEDEQGGQAEPIRVFDAIVASQAARRIAFANTLIGRGTPSEAVEPTTPGGFDGGARTPAPPKPPTDGEWLADVLKNRRADVGSRL